MTPQMQEQIADTVIDRAIQAGKDRREHQSMTDHACYALLLAVTEMEGACAAERRERGQEALLATADEMASRLLKLVRQMKKGQDS